MKTFTVLFLSFGGLTLVWPSILNMAPALPESGITAFTAVFVGLILMASISTFGLVGAVSRR